MNEPTKGGRYFIVQAKQDGARCLVEANTISSALRRAAQYYCEARAAKPAEIVALMQEGCEVIEIVSGEDIELPLPEPVQADILDTTKPNDSEIL